MNKRTVKQSTSRYSSSILDEIEEIRASIVDLEAKRFEVEMLPPPKRVALQRLDGWIKGLSANYPSVESSAGKFLNPSAAVVHDIVGPDTGRFLAQFVAPAIREEYSLEINRLYETQTGIEDNERASQIDAIDDAIFELGLAEERLIRVCEDSGQFIARRRGSNPMIVLAADEELS